ncbi:MAG: ketoacyl-ACP synthase III, partial [Pseudobdellovibrionaceae bacterium]
MIFFQSVYIKSLAHALPDRVVSNDELIQNYSLKMKSSWVETRLGIRERRWLSSDQTTSDLAAQAIQKLKTSECPIYLSTISPDYLTPSTASETKRKLQWKNSSPATDLSAACAGFIFALEMGSLYVSHQTQGDAIVAAAEARS